MTAARRTGLLTLVILACLSNGCSFGPTVRTYRPAQTPKGVNMRVETAQGKLSGELIEVRDAGIIVLVDQKLRFCPTQRSCHQRLIRRHPSTPLQTDRPETGGASVSPPPEPLSSRSYARVDAAITGRIWTNGTGRRQAMK